MENESKSTVGPAVKEGEEYGGSALGNEDIVGYVKGGPLEKYGLRRGTFDVNYGKKKYCVHGVDMHKARLLGVCWWPPPSDEFSDGGKGERL